MLNVSSPRRRTMSTVAPMARWPVRKSAALAKSTSGTHTLASTGTARDRKREVVRATCCSHSTPPARPPTLRPDCCTRRYRRPTQTRKMASAVPTTSAEMIQCHHGTAAAVSQMSAPRITATDSAHTGASCSRYGSTLPPADRMAHCPGAAATALSMRPASASLVATAPMASRPSWMALCREVLAPGAAALSAIVLKKEEAQSMHSTSNTSREPSVRSSCAIRSPPGATLASQHCQKRASEAYIAASRC
mmetsp:Transcript_33001/g.106723  ORF Transcript_33001/g.106723 Transcript_33001/m.106723 type:complete len:249 (+) Transcript_33001:2352-3098(+)